MESNNESKQELNPDQMEMISGGAGFNRICHVCGHESDRKKDPMHEFNCMEELRKKTLHGDN